MENSSKTLALASPRSDPDTSSHPELCLELTDPPLTKLSTKLILHTPKTKGKRQQTLAGKFALVRQSSFLDTHYPGDRSRLAQPIS